LDKMAFRIDVYKNNEREFEGLGAGSVIIIPPEQVIREKRLIRRALIERVYRNYQRYKKYQRSSLIFISSQESGENRKDIYEFRGRQIIMSDDPTIKPTVEIPSEPELGEENYTKLLSLLETLIRGKTKRPVLKI